jgi:ubiquinone/menaquinone biosynthesis C-methylase UbiE
LYFARFSLLFEKLFEISSFTVPGSETGQLWVVMGHDKSFYERYWSDSLITVNPFDPPPAPWTQENFQYHWRFFKSYAKGVVLDYGCGRGDFTQFLIPHAASVHGVDVSEKALQMARQSTTGIDFKLLVDSTIPYPDNFFDTIFSVDVLEHILDIEATLEEIHRILKPGGVFLIATSEFTRLKMMLILIVAFHRFFYPTTPHIRYFSRWNLADLLIKKGFKPVAYQKNRTYLGFIPQGQLVAAQKI